MQKSLSNIKDKLNKISNKNYYEQGMLKICIANAEIEKDSDKYFGKMDPFVEFSYNEQTYRTATSRGKGAKPVWN